MLLASMDIANSKIEARPMSAALLISLPLMANQFNSAGIFGCAIIYDFYSFAMNEKKSRLSEIR